MSYKKITPLDYVNDVEYNLKEFVEQELDGYYVFELDNSYNAVNAEPYKPVYYFQLGDTNRLRKNVVISDGGKRGDIIVLQYLVFVLLNNEYSSIKTNRELNKISNELIDTLDLKKGDLLTVFNEIDISSQVDGTIKAPNGFSVNKHFLNIKIIKEK